MGTRLRALILEDSEDDAFLLMRELQRLGYEVEVERVDTATAMQSALAQKTWDIILSDYSMPTFNAPQALEVLKVTELDIPFILVSGTVGEESAVSALKSGANDFLIKGNYARLGPAIERELREAEARHKRKQAEEYIQYQSNLLQNVSDAIIGSDLNFMITSWNPAAEAIYGWRAEEVIGRLVNDVLHTTYEYAEPTQVSQQFLEQGLWKGEAIQQRKDGSQIIVLSSVSLVRDGSGRPVAVVGVNRDISKRKETEQKLRASEEQYRSLFEDSPISLWVEDFSEVKHRLDALSAKGIQDIPAYLDAHPGFVLECASLVKVLDVNSATLKLYHAKEKTELLRSLIDVFPAPEAYKNELIQLANGRLNFEREEIEQTLTSQKIYVSVRWSVAPGYEDTLAKVIVSVMDITERKQAEESLRQSERKFKRLFEIAPVGISLLDQQRNVLNMNPALEAILHLTQAEMNNGKFKERTYILPNGIALPFDELPSARALRENHSILGEEFGIVLEGDQLVWTQVSATPLDLPDAKVVVVTQDITERKQAEEQLRESEEKFRQIAQAIDEVFWIADPDVIKMQYVSPAYERVWDRTIQSLYDDPESFFMAIHSDDRQRVRSDLLISRLAIPFSHEYRIVHEDGSLHWIWNRGFPILNAHGTVSKYVGVAIEITDRKQVQEKLQQLNIELEQRVAERTVELRRTNLELEQANRIKDEFLASTSHELRTPLNSILGLSETLLEQRRGPLNEYQQKSIQTVMASGQHLLELINDILDLSKLEAGKFEYHPQPVSVDDLCRSSLAFINSQAFKKSITVTYENETDAFQISADPRRIKQVLINLLTNAVKFTPVKGQIALRVQINLEDDRIQFSVIDNGIGIAPEDLQRLFHPFVQVDSSLNRQFEGTGLGLALVQKLTDLHGGSVEVESEVGKGSRFTINLPLGAEVPEQNTDKPLDKSLSGVSTQAANSISAVEAVAHHRVLLVEDNATNILVVQDYLENYGYEIILAHDGVEAIEKARQHQPDIILMDIQMPIMDGLEATQKLRGLTDFKEVPIVALTALAMAGDRERCLQAGANEYLSKPVSLKLLLKTVQNFIKQ